ncbi:MAG: hypothetical protein ACI9MR_003306 [Myxococcota bacterium]|jgi:hypothetical protein
MKRSIATYATTFALAAGFLGGPALAESPRSVMLELHVGTYTPDVDSQFTTATPYADVFGNSGLLTFKVGVDYQLWQAHGTLAAGVAFGYGFVDGKALTGDETSSDEVGFNMFPLQAGLVYRWDWAAVRHGVPLVPYFKAGFSGAIWWATNGKDEIANTAGPDGESRVGRGLTLGYHYGGGIQFLLDILAPGMAQGFDNESGVNNSFIFAEFLQTTLNDFGSDSSIDLSDAAFSFGLMFEF